MKRQLLPLLFLAYLSGCGSTQTCGPDPLVDATVATERRARESRRYDGIPRTVMYEHAAEVLLDMDCSIRESNASVGLISAVGRWECTTLDRAENVSPGAVLKRSGTLLPACFATCGGAEMQISVRPSGDAAVAVRASLRDPSPLAAQTFFRLLDRSLQGGAAQ